MSRGPDTHPHAERVAAQAPASGSSWEQGVVETALPSHVRLGRDSLHLCPPGHKGKFSSLVEKYRRPPKTDKPVAKVHRYYHVEYSLLPDGAEPKKVDVLLFPTVAKVFLDSGVKVNVRVCLCVSPCVCLRVCVCVSVCLYTCEI